MSWLPLVQQDRRPPLPLRRTLHLYSKVLYVATRLLRFNHPTRAVQIVAIRTEKALAELFSFVVLGAAARYRQTVLTNIHLVPFRTSD